MQFSIIGRYLPRAGYIPKVYKFLEILEQKGHKFDFHSLGDCLISFEYSSRDLKFIEHAIRRKIPRILVREETDAIYPVQYSPEVESYFDCVVTLGAIPGSLRGITLRHPYIPYKHNHQMKEMLEAQNLIQENLKSGIFDYATWMRRKEQKVFVGKNMLADNSILYRIRRTTLCDPNLGIDVYGENWGRISLRKMRTAIGFSRYQIKEGRSIQIIEVLNFLYSQAPFNRGHVEDKLELLKKSKLNIIFENSQNFVSEKVIDSLICGAIPIYVGPDLRWAPHLDQIVCRVQPPYKIDDWQKALGRINGEYVADWLTSTVKFLKSEEFFSNWSGSGVYMKLYHEIMKLHS